MGSHSMLDVPWRIQVLVPGLENEGLILEFLTEMAYPRGKFVVI